MEVRISLAGDLGSGKSTVSEIISKEFDATIYSTGKICREKAAEMGINDIKDMNLFMSSHPEIDKWIDDGLVALSDKKGNLIVDSRMAWHFTKGTYKLYLAVETGTAAERIFNAHRDTESYLTVEDTKASIIARRKSESERYLSLYGVEITDMMNYDLIVDTTTATPEEAANAVLDGCENGKRGCGMLCPERLFPTSDVLDDGEISVLAYKSNFYIISGHKAVADAIKEGKHLIECKMVAVADKEKFDNYDKNGYKNWNQMIEDLGVKNYQKV